MYQVPPATHRQWQLITDEAAVPHWIVLLGRGRLPAIAAVTPCGSRLNWPEMQQVATHPVGGPAAVGYCHHAVGNL